MGVLRTFESVGSTFSYAVGATHWPNLNQEILSFALWVTCLIPTTLAIARVPAEREEDNESKRDGQGKRDGIETPTSYAQEHEDGKEKVLELDGRQLHVLAA